MESSKTFFVTGMTGNQGSAVAKSLLNKGYRVIGLTRKPDSEKAERFRNLGAEIVSGDLNDINTYEKHLDRAHGVFGLTTYVNGIDKELRQAIQLIDLAKKKGIKHFLYSSVSGCDLNTGIPHWEVKHKIEEHVKSSGLPFTIIRPVSFYQNFLFPQVSSRINKGKLVTPTAATKTMQFISTDDIGPITVKIFENPQQYLGKTITIGTEQMDMKKVAETFSKVLGRQISYQKLPGFITRLAMGKNLHKMFNWCNNNDCVFIKDLGSVKTEFRGMTPMDQWIKQHFT